ncbi:MAG: rhomboid family intramembrane serine protease [Pseudonocardiaceae bacterium]
MTGPACVRHPGRPTGARCNRCDRPACPACLREASVGYQCVDCVGSQPRTWAVPWAQPATTSVVVPTLIVINVAIFLVTVLQAGSLSDNTGAELFQQWALRPAAVAQGAWWQLLTAGFLHIGPLHLAVNMYALWVIGRDLEKVLGRARFVAVYLVSLLGGSLVVYLVSLLGGPLAVLLHAEWARQTAGASGAVFGLMGGLVVVLMRLHLSLRPALTIILLNVIISFALPNISILGHLGGLAFGTAITAVMVYGPTSR